MIIHMRVIYVPYTRGIYLYSFCMYIYVYGYHCLYSMVLLCILRKCSNIDMQFSGIAAMYIQKMQEVIYGVESDSNINSS